MNTNERKLITIIPAVPNDLPIICQLFEAAIQFQQQNNYIGWNSYDKDFIRLDIEKGLLYKMVHENEVICAFSICYSDAMIWREKEQANAIYLHRVIVNEEHRGEKLFRKVLDWAISIAREKRLTYIRIDTWANNAKLIAYYTAYGFSFVENYTTANILDLPVQHRNLTVALLELKVPEIASFSHVHPKLEKVNILQQFASLDEYWMQKVIGESNGQLIKLAKGIGEINWHKHDDQDELFILYSGHLTIQFKDQHIDLFPHELCIVPKGTEHCPVAHVDSRFLTMGLNITSNTAGGRPAI